MCHAGFGGVDSVTNEYYCFLETFGGGYGGRHASDGPDAVQAHGQNTENAPVEETELNYPVRVDRLWLVDDSDGAGTPPRRARAAEGLPLRPPDDVHRPLGPDRRPARPAPSAASTVELPSTCSSAAARRPACRQRRPSTLEAGDVVSYRTCGGGGYGPPEERDPERVLRDVLEDKVSVERARDVYRVAVAVASWTSRDREATRIVTPAVDPITFEVIRNALVAATDEMVLALKRSAYSTNIKTRSDFSCAFFDARAPLGRAGLCAAGAPRLDGRAGAARRAAATASERLRPGDVIVTNDPHPSGVHLNDVSLISPVFVEDELLGYVANLAHHVDVGRWRAGLDRRVPGGVPGRRDHPARPARLGRRDRRRRLPPRPRADPLEARDGGRLPRADRRERDGGAARAGAGRRARARDDPADDEELLEYTERRTRAELEALPHGVYESEGFVDNDGYTDEPVRLQIRIELGPGRRLVRHERLGSAAARPGQLDVRADVLGVRVRAQVPDRPRPAGQRRLLPADPARRAPGDGDELHVARARGRRLGDADAPRGGHVPRPPAGLPGAAAGGHEGDDVPGRVRLPRRRRRNVHLLLRHLRGRVRRAATRATDRTPSRRTARTPRTRRSRRPSSTIRSGSTGWRSSRTPRGRDASVVASVSARTTASTCTRRSPSSRTVTGTGPGARRAAAAGASRSTCTSATGSRPASGRRARSTSSRAT